MSASVIGQITIHAHDLARAAKCAAAVCDKRKKPVVQIWATLELYVEGNYLAVRGTDGQTWITVWCGEVVGEVAGTFTPTLVEGRVLVKAIAAVTGKSKRDALVTLELASGTITLRGPGGAITLPVTEGDLPLTPSLNDDDHPTIAYDAASFAAGLGYALLAASTNSALPHLCGVLLHKSVAVATDGHRLYVARVAQTDDGGVDSADTRTDRWLLPAKAAVALRASIAAYKPSTVSGRFVPQGFARFDSASFAVTTRLIGDGFPPYENIIRKVGANAGLLQFDRKAMCAMLANLSNKKSVKISVDFHAPTALTITHDSDGETFSGVVPGDYTSGDDATPDKGWHIGIDPRYLADALSCACEDLVTLHVADSVSAVMVKYATGNMAIVMPIKV